MLSSVLRSKKAVQVNISIMRTFIRLREILATHKDLARKVQEHDRQIGALLSAVQKLLAPPEPPKNSPSATSIRRTSVLRGVVAGGSPPASAAPLCPSPSPCAGTRPLFHRRIFEIHDAVGGRATDEFSGKSAPDVILLNRPERSRNEAPQTSNIARSVSIASDNSGPENRQSFEADALNRFFF